MPHPTANLGFTGHIYESIDKRSGSGKDRTLDSVGPPDYETDALRVTN